MHTSQPVAREVTGGVRSEKKPPDDSPVPKSPIGMACREVRSGMSLRQRERGQKFILRAWARKFHPEAATDQINVTTQRLVHGPRSGYSCSMKAEKSSSRGRVRRISIVICPMAPA